MRKIQPRTRARYERNDDEHEDTALQREMGDQCTQVKRFFYPSHYKYFIVEGIPRTHSNKGNI